MHKVFVYGSLKKGFGNHGVIRNGEFVGEGVTANPAWNMFSMGGFPGVVRGDKRLSGEVYIVDEEGLRHLDQLEGNGHFYTREIVPTSEGDAWMYVLPDDDRQHDMDGVEEVNGNLTWKETWR